MKMALEKGTREWQMFGDFFTLCKKNWEVVDNDTYWENVIDDVNNFYNKYKDIPLSKALAIAFSETQDKLAREKTK